MNVIFYLVAVVLFGVAALTGGLDTGWQDLTALGLAFFSAAHVVPGGWPDRP